MFERIVLNKISNKIFSENTLNSRINTANHSRVLSKQKRKKPIIKISVRCQSCFFHVSFRIKFPEFFSSLQQLFLYVFNMRIRVLLNLL